VHSRTQLAARVAPPQKAFLQQPAGADTTSTP
jgi:hypothetical protein